jgi:hypothetical protein
MPAAKAAATVKDTGKPACPATDPAGPFKLCPAKEDTVGLAHAASRSLADK